MLKADFPYLTIPDTGQPKVHPRELPVGGSIGDEKGGGYIPPDSALTICSLRTKLISDTQGALRAGEREGGGESASNV